LRETDSCARGGTKPLEIGTQVFNTYGAKSNEELLLGYAEGPCALVLASRGGPTLCVTGHRREKKM
jgi:hypothetical protein